MKLGIAHSYQPTKIPVFSLPSRDVLVTRVALIILATSIGCLFMPSVLWCLPGCAMTIQLLWPKEDSLVKFMYRLTDYEKLPVAELQNPKSSLNYIAWFDCKETACQFRLQDGRKGILINVQTFFEDTTPWGKAPRQCMVLLVERLSPRDYLKGSECYREILKQALGWRTVNLCFQSINRMYCLENNKPRSREIVLAGHLPYQLVRW